MARACRCSTASPPILNHRKRARALVRRCNARSDNGLIFQSKRFRAACRDYRLTQEYITPYTPEQNGLIERWFRSLKEECIWVNRFADFAAARRAIAAWIAWYNAERPHQCLGYRSPVEFRGQSVRPAA